jgi:tetratricopeptide (TPR) repeat protein
LKVTLEGEQTPKAQDTNPEAYNAYLQGRYFQDRRTKEGFEKAISYYEQALKIDPNYARAWVGLSRVHGNQAGLGHIAMEEGMNKARKEAKKALVLNPTLAEAYAQIGWIKMIYDWDWTGADAALDKALELEPANADVVRRAANLASTLGRFDEAITLNRRTIELDPLRVVAYNNMGLSYYFAGRFNEAEAAFRKVLELNPQQPGSHLLLGQIYLVQSKLPEALAEIQREQDPLFRGMGLALVYHAEGKKKEAEDVLTAFIEKSQDAWAVQIAEIYAYRGEIDKAFEWLERAYKQRDLSLSEIKGNPLLRNLEKDSRYTAFLQKMKLPVD